MRIEFGTGPGHDQARNQVEVSATAQDLPKRDEGELYGPECDQTMARGQMEWAELKMWPRIMCWRDVRRWRGWLAK